MSDGTIIDRELELSKMKVADLKKELKSRGLSVEGKKNELIERLQLSTGDSQLLDETVEGDDLLSEDGLSDEDNLDSELSKEDVTNISPEDQFTTKTNNGTERTLKRKPSEDSNPDTGKPKKIVLNRTAVPLETPPAAEPEKKVKVEERKIVKLSTIEKKEPLALNSNVGISTEARKEARAARFGLNVLQVTSKATDINKVVGGPKVNQPTVDMLQRRAQRFGVTTPGSILEQAAQEERRKQRLERFGSPQVSTSAGKVKITTLASDVEEKKKLRAERFKTTT